MTVSRVPLSSLANGTVWALTGGLLTPAAGATAFVYEHGTTNEVTVYAGQTGETTLTQPLTTSTGGQLPGYVLGEQDLDIVATFEGKTPPAAEVVPLRAADIVGEDSHTKGPALGAGVVPLLSGQGGGAVSEAEVTTAVAAEATTRAAADTTLANAITAAITTAEAASDTAGTAAADVKVEKERAEAAEVLKIPLTQRGAANGVPTLDGEEHLTLSQVPPSVANGSTASKGQYPRATGAGVYANVSPFWIDPIADYGVKWDLRFYKEEGAISSTVNPTQLTVAGYVFATADIGKKVKVLGAGVAGAPLMTRIEGVIEGRAVLAEGASTTVTKSEVSFGTDDTTALNEMFTAVGLVEPPIGRRIVLPQGTGLATQLLFPRMGKVVGCTEDWIGYGTILGTFTGCQNNGGSNLYQMWGVNQDFIRFRESVK